jgi:hypothetical protein
MISNIPWPTGALQNQCSSTRMFTNLSSLSQDAHKLATKYEDAIDELLKVEEEIDHKVAEHWGLTDEELKDIQASLKEIS